jgi:Fic family protein
MTTPPSLHPYLAALDQLKAKLDALRPFPKAAVARLHNQMVIEWTYNSNAIEGNTLTLKETALVLQQGITISGKPLREHMEAVNHREAIMELERFVRERKAVNESALRSLHGIILKGIDDHEAGQWRKERVRILGAIHLPPDPRKIPALHPILRAALAHHRLVHIHPFIDGNGRCARLLMNLLLMQSGYPPAVILKTDRRKYYRVLQEADQEHYEDYFRFIMRSVDRSMALYLQALTPSTHRDYEKQGYITLAQAAKGTPYSQEYLSLLVRKGRLAAVKFQRNWMTTHDAVREYIAEHGKKANK